MVTDKTGFIIYLAAYISAAIVLAAHQGFLEFAVKTKSMNFQQGETAPQQVILVLAQWGGMWCVCEGNFSF